MVYCKCVLLRLWHGLHRLTETDGTSQVSFIIQLRLHCSTSSNQGDLEDLTLIFPSACEQGTSELLGLLGMKNMQFVWTLAVFLHLHPNNQD